MWFLHVGVHPHDEGTARAPSRTHNRRDPSLFIRQPLPLRRLSGYSQGRKGARHRTNREEVMRKSVWLLPALLFCATIATAQTRKTLDIYVVDVEGGNAVLFVTPSGESMLVDSGNGGAAAVRDAERIVAAAKDAGVTAIDHLITTHYHGDHIGGHSEPTPRIAM